MNLRLAGQVLQRLEQRVAAAENRDQRLRSRIAAQWLRVAVANVWDSVIRTTLLEGAAGVPRGAWSKLGARGLLKAQAAFDESAPQMSPEWFDPKGSKVYQFLMANIQKRIVSMRLTLEPSEILTEAIMGIGSQSQVVKSIPYEIGKYRSAEIKSGEETPMKLAALLLSLIHKKMLNEVSRNKHVTQMTPEIEQGMESGEGASPSDFGPAVIEILFGSPGDPLSRELRSLMRAVWHDSPPMLKWLDTVENEHVFPVLSKLTESLEISLTGFITNHWKTRWRKFFAVLQSRQSLLNKLTHRFEAMGLEWDPEEAAFSSPAAMDALLKPRADRPRV